MMGLLPGAVNRTAGPRRPARRGLSGPTAFDIVASERDPATRRLTMRRDRPRRAWAAFAVLALPCLLAPAAAAPQARAGSPEMAALVPKPAGWALTEAPRSYFPDDLFEYIDGAAESYVSYDMGLPVNAFGIFAAERYPESKPVSLGERGYVEGEALNFLDGRYYVKMLAFGLDAATESVLAEFGAKLAAGIKPGGGLPPFIRAFPRENLVGRSEKYVKKNFMGYEFLHDGYVASYRSGGKELEGFIVDAGSEKDAASMLSSLL